MTDQILVPVDGSEESERALNVALPLAEARGCSIRLLWAWQGLEDLDAVVTAEVREAISQREVADRGERLREIGTRRCDPTGIAWTAETPTGKPAEVIIEASSAPEVLYVVMTTHGRSGLQRWRLGSVADRVVRTITKPTVLFHPSEEIQLWRKVRTILAPLDGSELSESALPEVVALAQATEASVQLLRTVSAIVAASPMGMEAMYEDATKVAVEVSQEYLNGIKERLDGGIPATASVLLGGADSIIIAAAEEADLIVLASHGRGGLARMALGSVTDAVVRGSGKPVMIIPAPAAD